jgi:prepilin-type N-terminal cleavage/methylation domain-containing protein/prepilin-type processing-associated H-X9-DG protein
MRPENASINRDEGCKMHRKAFTVIELLVCVAVVGLLMAILIPAVMMARESARRMQCQNNLRQLGLAILNYESQSGMLPHGLLIRFTLLPYLDMQSVHSLYDPAPPPEIFEGSFRKMKDLSLPIYLCPSDPAKNINDEGAAANYVACFGSGWPIGGADGAFGVWGYSNSGITVGPVRLADISDGTSNVPAMSEMLYYTFPRTRLRSTWITPWKYSLTETEAFQNICETIPADPGAYGWNDGSFRGIPWYRGGFAGSYNHLLPPNRPSCTNQGALAYGIFPATSMHPGGVHVLFVDGHIHFESESVDRKLWQHIGSRNDAAVSNP